MSTHKQVYHNHQSKSPMATPPLEHQPSGARKSQPRPNHPWVHPAGRPTTPTRRRLHPATSYRQPLYRQSHPPAGPSSTMLSCDDQNKRRRANTIIIAQPQSVVNKLSSSEKLPKHPAPRGRPLFCLAVLVGYNSVVEPDPGGIGCQAIVRQRQQRFAAA